jgi:KDO2-lipid IV(A) lauroyltransferase
LNNLKRGGHSSFLCDLTVKPTQAATVIRCFGLKMSTTVLHAALSRWSGLPVIPTISRPQPDGTYEVRHWPAQFFPPELTFSEIAQRLWDLFEPCLREQPEHWLWMYKHWRFIPADSEGREYPAYANRSKRFDALEARELGTRDKG